jgi:hypothetical protein
MVSMLDPVLVAVFPRWSEAVPVVCKASAKGPLPTFAVALAETEDQARHFRKGWSHDEQPLLLFRCAKGESVTLGAEVVQEIAAQSPGHPVGVLLGDGPDVAGFREGRRDEWNRRFAREISRALNDVQVFEYVPQWEENPPRIR